MRLIIRECVGYELEKEKSNTSEDFFNRSEVTFTEEAEERTLHVLYLRYFEEIRSEFMSSDQDPIFVHEGRDVNFKDVVALICLLKNPDLQHRKRLYINSKQEFAAYFQNVDFSKLPEVFMSIKQRKGYVVSSPQDFILQPN
jgi:hypothetical protein